jgi:hypothetical protein
MFSLPAWSAQAISIPGPGQGYQITKNDSGPKNGMERSNFAAGCFWQWMRAQIPDPRLLPKDRREPGAPDMEPIPINERFLVYQ